MQAPSDHVVTKSTAPDMLAHALAYLPLGWSIIPVCSPAKRGCLEHGPNCDDPGKVPLVAWKAYQTTRPTEAQVRGWWKHWPSANIALITGELSGVDVVDLDNAMALNEANARGLPPGPWSTTGRVGGQHRFFAHTPESPHNFVKQAGIDFRGEGGYAILAPSLHASGARYTWQQAPTIDASTGSLEITDTPAWVPVLAIERPSNGSRSSGAGGWNGSIWDGIPEGQRNHAVFGEAARMRGAGVRHDVATVALQTVAARCQPPLSPDEAQKAIDSAYSRYTVDSPRLRVKKEHGQNGGITGEPQAAADLTGGLICFEDVVAEKLQWLWHGRIPLGKLTVFDGDPGLGKSMITLDIAARLSRGDLMPDDSRSDVDGPCDTIIMSLEDNDADTIKPRLIAAGADMRHVHELDHIPDGDEKRIPEFPRDLPALEACIRKTGARLVIMDVLMAYLGSEVNVSRDHDVRRALAPLSRMAQQTGCAILVIRHLNKSSNPNAVYRGGGSIGISGAARSVLVVAADPDDPDSGRRILAQAKPNLSAACPSLTYHLESDGEDSASVVWDGPTDASASSLLAAGWELPEDRADRTEAAQFLKQALEEGERKATEIEREAKELGISIKRLRSARLAIGARTEKRGFGTSEWFWSLPQRLALRISGAPKEAKEDEEGEGGREKITQFEPRARENGGNSSPPSASFGKTASFDGPRRRAPSQTCEGCGERDSHERGPVIANANSTGAHWLHMDCEPPR